MRTVKQVSRLAGVSVRTLHHYDAIGLLKPSATTEAGYRLYDDMALGRLQTILLFRELQFPLRKIRDILDSTDFDPAEALAQQIELLELQRRHIGELISFAREIQKKGVKKMTFDVFGKAEIEQYKTEARAKWGGTQAYREYEQKGCPSSAETGQALMTLFAGLGTLRQESPAAQAVQEKIQALQGFITSHYYTCTTEILSGLGQMYAGDERFRQSIDQAGGESTAEFVRQAIEIYCSGKYKFI